MSADATIADVIKLDNLLYKKQIYSKFPFLKLTVRDVKLRLLAFLN